MHFQTKWCILHYLFGWISWKRLDYQRWFSDWYCQCLCMHGHKWNPSLILCLHKRVSAYPLLAIVYTPLLAPFIVAFPVQGRVPFRLCSQNSHPNLCCLQLAFNSWVSVSVSLFTKVSENSISPCCYNHLLPLCPPPLPLSVVPVLSVYIPVYSLSCCSDYRHRFR